MVIHPKVRGFICTTTHPLGCEKNVLEQIRITQAQGVRSDGPKRVLVIGASTGYGLAARITAAFDGASVGSLVTTSFRTGCAVAITTAFATA